MWLPFELFGYKEAKEQQISNNLNIRIMKKLMMTLMAVTFAIAANAQGYNVGSSNTTTDYFGNQTTTHRDKYGNTTGTSTSSTDYFGNTTTTHRDRYGNTICLY